MAAATSFYFGIFKKLQVIAGLSAGGYPHCRMMPENLGFNVTTPDANAFFHPLDPQEIAVEFMPLLPLVSDATPANPVYVLLPTGAPLSNVPEANPLYAMFKASIDANGKPVEAYWTSLTVPVQGSAKLWPIMPMCYDAMSPSDFIKMWLEFNTPGPANFLSAFKDWIIAGKPNDAPKQALNFTAPTQSSNQHPVVFVSSRIDDNGVRPSAGLDQFWATSRIFLAHPDGPSIGKIAFPAELKAGDVYNVVAQIGNSGTQAGRCPNYLSNVKVRVYADAFAFNTKMSQGGVPLPALSSLDAAGSDLEYEQYYAGPNSYDLAGFRFDVSKVFNGLKASVADAIVNNNFDTGGATAEDWVAHSHPCVMVRIGIGADANNKLPTTAALPKTNPRIAQKNLVTFEDDIASNVPPPLPPWHNFIVEQPLEFFPKGAGPSGLKLALQNHFAEDACKVFLAVPARTFRRYFAGNKGLEGFAEVPEKELAREIGGERVKPFPDAVILRATGRKAALTLTLDAKQRMLGMSLGIFRAPAKRGTRALGSVSIAHEALRARQGKSTVVGGFTIRFVAKARPAAR